MVCRASSDMFVRDLVVFLMSFMVHLCVFCLGCFLGGGFRGDWLAFVLLAGFSFVLWFLMGTHLWEVWMHFSIWLLYVFGFGSIDSGNGILHIRIRIPE